VPTRGRENRYKLPGPGRPEGARGPTMLHMFLSVSAVSSFVECTLSDRSPSHSATDSLSDLPCRFLAGPPLLGWKVGRFLFYRGVNPLSAILLPSTFRSPKQLPLASNFPTSNARLLQFLNILTSHIVRDLISEHLTQMKHNSVRSQLVLMFILPRFKPRGSDLTHSCIKWENKNTLKSANPYVCPALQVLTQQCDIYQRPLLCLKVFQPSPARPSG